MKALMSNHSRNFALVALTIVSAVPTMAQGENHANVPPSAIVRLNRAPVDRHTLHVVFPRPKQFVLPNGLRILVLEDHKLPTVSMSMSILAGSFFEPAEKVGLASMTADMLDEGTQHYTSAQLASVVDRLGASLNASADQGGDRARASVSGLSNNTDKLLGLLAEVVLHPTFPNGQLIKQKQQEAAGLAEAVRDANTMAEVVSMRDLYGDTPPARVLPTVAEVNALTSGDLKTFHATYYRPDRTVLAVVGNVNAADIAHKVKLAFGSWQRGTEPMEPDLPDYQPQNTTAVYLVDRPSSVQTVLRVGNLAIKRKSPDFAAVTVMNRILGGDPLTSRLGANLREAKGYTYDIRSTVDAPWYPGFFGADTQVRNAVTGDAVKQLLFEFQRIQDTPVTDRELDAAKRGIVGAFARRLESPETILGYAMDIVEFGLPANYWDTYPARIQSVSKDEIQNVAQKYIGAGRLQIIAVGETSAIQDALKTYGPVHLVTDINAPLP